MSIAVSCQIAPSVAFQATDVEAVNPNQLAGPLELNVLLWS
jgi:hypothetical protein